jgi:hypothetical protein
VKTAKSNEPGILQSLDEFWFGRGSPTALGLFRIIMGSLAFINLVMISLDWDAWFSEQGFVPSWLGRRWLGGPMPLWPDSTPVIPRLNLLDGITSPYLGVAFYGLVTFFALTTAFGLWTRFSTIALAVGIVTLHHRNALILHGGDTVLRVMVLYLAISPCGRACSLDRLFRLWNGKDSGAPVRISLWPQRLIQYNMALIYFTTLWLKWYGSLWKNGTATWYPARLAEFYRFPVPAFVNELPFVKITTYGTLLIEFALGTLVFYKPARKWVLLSGIALHGWIEYSMNIPLFGYLMVSMYICFYEGTEIQDWAIRVGRAMKRYAVTVHLPAGMRLDPRGVAFFDAADPFKLVTYTPGSDDRISSGDARRSWTHSLGAWTCGWIPGLWRRLLSEAAEPIPDELPEEPRAKKHKAKT